MAPRNKKTTMAKLAREHKLRERRLDKQTRKDARKHAASIGSIDSLDSIGSLDSIDSLDSLDSAHLAETPAPKEA